MLSQFVRKETMLDQQALIKIKQYASLKQTHDEARENIKALLVEITRLKREVARSQALMDCTEYELQFEKEYVRAVIRSERETEWRGGGTL